MSNAPAQQQTPQGGDTTITIKSPLATKLIESVWDWAQRRDPVATLCLLMLLVVGYGIWTIGTRIIPDQIRDIQASQKELADAYIADRNKLTEQYLSDKRELRERHTKDLHAVSSNFEAIVERFERIATIQERLVRDLILRETAKPPGGVQ